LVLRSRPVVGYVTCSHISIRENLTAVRRGRQELEYLEKKPIDFVIIIPQKPDCKENNVMWAECKCNVFTCYTLKHFMLVC
jgi:hypothetical protein